MLARMFPIIAMTAGIIAILWHLTLCANPSSRCFKMLERVCSGIVCLYGWNWLLGGNELMIGVNPVTVAAAGWLGLPGVAMLAAIRAMN